MSHTREWVRDIYVHEMQAATEKTVNRIGGIVPLSSANHEAVRRELIAYIDKHSKAINRAGGVLAFMGEI